VKHKRNENNKTKQKSNNINPPQHHHIQKKKIIQPEFSPGHSKCHWKVLTFSLQIGHHDTLINTGNKSLYKTYYYNETNIDFVW